MPDIDTELENLLDAANLAAVLAALARIAREKADHLRSNWQDNAHAKLWDGAAVKLDSLAERFEGVL